MKVKGILFGGVFAVTLVVASLAILPVNDAHAPLLPVEHFETYLVTAEITSGAGVTLEDQFGISEHIVNRLEQFAIPVQKNDEPLDNTTSHLSFWTITDPTFIAREVVVDNQFGEQSLKVFDGIYLAAPALKNDEGRTELPTDLSHFKCYKVQGVAPGNKVTITGQFGTHTTTVLQPGLLCVPAKKTTDKGVVYPVVNPMEHLLCYKIEVVGTGQTVLIRDQFSTSQTPLSFMDLLCVPSMKNPPVPTEQSSWGKMKSIYR